MIEFDIFSYDFIPSKLSKEESDFLLQESVKSFKENLFKRGKSETIPNKLNLNILKCKLTPIIQLQNKRKELIKQLNENENGFVEMVRSKIIQPDIYDHIHDYADELIEDVQELKDEGVHNPRISGNVLKTNDASRGDSANEKQLICSKCKKLIDKDDLNSIASLDVKPTKAPAKINPNIASPTSSSINSFPFAGNSTSEIGRNIFLKSSRAHERSSGTPAMSQEARISFDRDTDTDLESASQVSGPVI